MYNHEEILEEKYGDEGAPPHPGSSDISRWHEPIYGQPLAFLNMYIELR